MANWQAEKWVLQGEADFQSGQLDSAQRIFEALLSRLPNHTRAGNDLACVLWQGDTDGEGIAQAKEILTGILAREPENEDARWNLAEVEGVGLEVG